MENIYVRSWYEVGDRLGPIAEKLWLDLKPFYEELHAYVRFKLTKKYPEVTDGEPIPAHLLGNMWAQGWVNIYNEVAPFPSKLQKDDLPIYIFFIRNLDHAIVLKVSKFNMEICLSFISKILSTKSFLISLLLFEYMDFLSYFLNTWIINVVSNTARSPVKLKGLIHQIRIEMFFYVQNINS